MMALPALDLTRLDKGELRCLVQALVDASGGIRAGVLESALHAAASERAARLGTIAGEALHAWLTADENERKVLKAGKSATRLTKTRMDAELAWRRADRAQREAYAVVDRRWAELKATWTCEREIEQ